MRVWVYATVGCVRVWLYATMGCVWGSCCPPATPLLGPTVGFGVGASLGVCHTEVCVGGETPLLGLAIGFGGVQGGLDARWGACEVSLAFK